MKRIFVAIAVIIFSCSSVLATSPQDVNKVFRAVKNDRDKLLSYKEYPDHDGSFQSVYVVNGKRYTVYYSGKKFNYLSLWVRPDGTSSMKLVETFTDYGLDGKVEFGIKDEPNRKLFDIDTRNVGREHQKYWQKIYDTAIADALQHFNRQ